MSIAQKEARETLYWLRLVAQSDLLTAEKMAPIIQEAGEILRIVSAIIVSARKNEARSQISKGKIPKTK